MAVTANTQIKRSDSLMSARLGDFEAGVVLLNKRNNAYFGLDGVAAFIWEQLEEPLPVSEIVARVTQEYEIDVARAEEDARAFLERLIERGLVDVANENAEGHLGANAG